MRRKSCGFGTTMALICLWTLRKMWVAFYRILFLSPRSWVWEAVLDVSYTFVPWYSYEPTSSWNFLQVRFRVVQVKYPIIPLEQEKDARPFAPMTVTVCNSVSSSALSVNDTGFALQSSNLSHCCFKLSRRVFLNWTICHPFRTSKYFATSFTWLWFLVLCSTL